jgi:hypothetical protein
MFLYYQGGHFDAKDFLLYYYYGGMIYTALKNNERALYFYEIVSRILYNLIIDV